MISDSVLLTGPYPAESAADKKRMEQVAPGFKLLARALQGLILAHDKVLEQFIVERQAAGESITNNSAQVELCLRMEQCTKTFDMGVQALYGALKALRLIGRCELAVEQRWRQTYDSSKSYAKKNKLTPTETIDTIVAVKELRQSEPKLLAALEQCLRQAQEGSDADAQQAATVLLAQLPTLSQILANPKSSSCISVSLKWLKDC